MQSALIACGAAADRGSTVLMLPGKDRSDISWATVDLCDARRGCGESLELAEEWLGTFGNHRDRTLRDGEELATPALSSKPIANEHLILLSDDET